MATQYYYDKLPNDQVFFYALDMAYEQYIYSKFFPNETDRIVYSTNAFALKKRAKDKEWNSSLMPFMNFRRMKVSLDSSRLWNNYPLATTGYASEILNDTIKQIPIKVNYESQFYFHQDTDLIRVANKLLYMEYRETVINTLLQHSSGNQLNIFGLYKSNIDTHPSFQEDEWLLKNNINIISNDFEMYTVLPETNDEGSWWWVDNVVLNFNTLYNNGDLEYSEKIEFILDHFDEKVEEV